MDTLSTRAVLAIMASAVLCLAACDGAAPPEDAAPSIGVTPPTRVFDGLTHLPGHHANVWFSEGHEARSRDMAQRVDRVMEWFAPRLGMAPSVSLLVLSAQDWPAHTSFPVYGMPHFTDDSLLVVAAEDNEFWRSLVPPLDALPPELAAAVQGAYADGSGGLTLGSFFDLLAIHELGHAYHVQGGLRIQRPSMGELFTNILLHTYVAEVEPHLLPVLTAFPMSIVALGSSGLRYTSLADLEARYDEIGQQHPQNYAWYQCRWHTAGGEMYDAGGPKVIVRLWAALRDEQELLDDEGGRDLEGEGQSYTYFLIRDGGEFIVKRREGAAAPTLVAWTVHPAVRGYADRGNDASVRNVLTVAARSDMVRFMINGEEVAALPRSGLSVEGTVGIRANHALNLHVSRLDVTPTG